MSGPHGSGPGVSGLRLLADDLTGALDTAAELVGLTGPIHAFWHGAIPPELPRDAALDSGTREADPRDAVATAAALTPHLAGAGIAYKKLDSLLRGPGLAELAACLRRGPWVRCVLAPAFPYQRRVTRGGRQYAAGADGRWSAVSGDIVAALRAEGADARPARPGADMPPGITVFDAETDEDLRAVVEAARRVPGPPLWSGSGGLAQALARGHAQGCAGADAAAPAALPRPVLGVFGSDQGATAAQLAACGADWLRLPDGGAGGAPLVARRLRERGAALVSFDLPAGSSRAGAARRIGAEVARLVADMPPPGTLLAAGGETLRGLCLALGAGGLLVRGRIVPGVPRSTLCGGRWDGVAVVSKSGAFGPPTLLRDLLHAAPEPHTTPERRA